MVLRDGGLISIIIPVYNVKDYLDRCMDSIVNQTYINIEIILIDDGSDDGSGEMCDRWARQDCRIKVFHKTNGGLSSARNLGLDKAAGKYIGFVDSDDYIKEDMYELLLAGMEKEIDIACCGTMIVYPEEQKRRVEYYDRASSRKVFSNSEAVRELLIKRYLSFSSCNKLFRRELYRQLKYPVGKTSEDLPVTYELVKRSRKVVNIGKTRYFYCYRKDSITKSPFKPERVHYILFARDILKDVVINYPTEQKAAEALYIRNIVAVVNEIDRCGEHEKYKDMRARLKKVLLRMYINILRNQYITIKMKKDILRLL